jgi:hypothetical protein
MWYVFCTQCVTFIISYGQTKQIAVSFTNENSEPFTLSRSNKKSIAKSIIVSN